MQICSWSATEIIYSTKAIRRSDGAVWKGGCETHDKCQSAWERASNAVRIMIDTLKQKQIPSPKKTGRSCRTDRITEGELKTYDLLICSHWSRLDLQARCGWKCHYVIASDDNKWWKGRGPYHTDIWCWASATWQNALIFDKSRDTSLVRNTSGCHYKYISSPGSFAFHLVQASLLVLCLYLCFSKPNLPLVVNCGTKRLQYFLESKYLIFFKSKLMWIKKKITVMSPYLFCFNTIWD